MKTDRKVAVITGGGSGIGRSLLELFYRDGMAVVICGRSLSRLQAAAAEVSRNSLSQPGRIYCHRVDVRIESEVCVFADDISREFGHVDILINSAGTIEVGSLGSVPETTWDSIVNTNLKGPFLVCKHLVPMLSRAGGTIVNVSSTLGQRGAAGLSAYCASKFGLIGFTQSIALELLPQGIKVLAACPDATLTDLHVRAVGAENARGAMSPSYVAQAIYALATGKRNSRSGQAVVIAASSCRRSSIKRRIARLLLRPLEPVIKRVYMSEPGNGC